MSNARTARLALFLSPLLLTRCNCNEQLGDAAPKVPQIDVCVTPSPGAAGLCYEAEKQARQDELCRGEGECLRPELTVDLGRIDPYGEAKTTVSVKNVGGAVLELQTLRQTAGPAYFRTTVAQALGDGPFLELAPGEEYTFDFSMRGTACGMHEAEFRLESNDAFLAPGVAVPASYDKGPPDTPVVIRLQGMVGGPCLCLQPPTFLHFGGVPVGQSKLLRASFESCGDEPLTVSETPITQDASQNTTSPVFSVESTSFAANPVLEPGAVGQVDVRCAPDAEDEDLGFLWIMTDSQTQQITEADASISPAVRNWVQLDGYGTPRPACKLQAIPTVASFGTVNGAANRTFRLYNAGEIGCRLFDVHRASGSVEFAVTQGAPAPEVSVQPSQSHNVVITYTPLDDTPDVAVFTAVADDIDGFESTVDIEVTGNPEIPTEGCVLNIQPDFGDFGDVTVGDVRSITFTIENVSEDDFLGGHCTFNSVALAAGAPDFRAADLGMFAGFGLLPGGSPLSSTTLTVTFEPQSEGVKNGILRFNTNDVTGSVRDVQLWGNALGSRLCIDATGASPATGACGPSQPCAAVDFGTTASEATRAVTLTNCGAGTLDIRGIDMDPAGGLAFIKLAPAASAMPVRLTAGNSAQVQIKYRPTTPGGDFGAFTVLSNAANAERARVDLRGNYDGDCPRILRCTPNPLQLGSVQIETTATRSIVCSSFGSEALTVSNVTRAGDAAITVATPTYSDLQPGDSFVVQVQCAPLTTGAKNATVTVTSTACERSPIDVSVSCMGLDEQPPACIGSDVFEPWEKWRWTGTPAYPQYDDVWMTPVVINLTDDNNDGAVDVLDIPDVIFTALKSVTIQTGTQNAICHANDSAAAIVVAVRGDTGQELWTWGRLPVGDPADPNALTADAEGQLAAADIDADGRPEIIGVKYTYIPPPDDCEMTDFECCTRGKFVHGSLFALEHDGTYKWESERWHLPDDAVENAGAPSIGDMDGDGFPEISYGNAVFDHNGLLVFEGITQTNSVVGHGEGGASHGPISVFADLDGDGTNELIAGRTAFRAGGTVLWDRTDLADGLTTVANLDPDPSPEIILLTGGDDLYVLEHTGATKYGPRHVSSGNVDENGSEAGFIATNPAIGDLDGDGLAEIVVAATNAVHAFEHDLTPKWSAAISDQTGASGPTTFDFEGDGRAEVVYADEENVYIWDGITAAIKYQAPRNSRTIIDNPVVVDVDNDGHADILLAMESITDGMHGLIAYSNDKNNWVGTRRVWNQHSYHVTNISESGVIPAFEGAGWLEHNVYRSNVVYCE